MARPFLVVSVDIYIYILYISGQQESMKVCQANLVL